MRAVEDFSRGCALGAVLLGGWLATANAGDQARENSPTVPTELQAVLPASDDETGFRPLFDGDLGWAQCGPGGFTLSNGIAASFGGMGLWWFTNQTFTNFVLRGEWKLEAADSDTGVFVRFANPGNDPWNAVRTGHELEIGDDPERKDPVWRTGALYQFSAPVRVMTKPIGEWNSYELAAVGHTYIVRINGETVNIWTDPDQRSASGYIGLQNYEEGKGAAFRSLRIRVLP
jgi:hypothetical protein